MKKIAVVEDDPDSQLLIKLLLSKDYEVVTYPTGMEAIEGFRRDKPDLALLDLLLPDMDGVELVRRIRADGALLDVPVVALTACALDEDRDRALWAGFDQFLTKPIKDARAFREQVARWVSPSAPHVEGKTEIGS